MFEAAHVTGGSGPDKPGPTLVSGWLILRIVAWGVGVSVLFLGLTMVIGGADEMLHGRDLAIAFGTVAVVFGIPIALAGLAILAACVASQRRRNAPNP